jgi:acetylglutamate kinase
MTSVLNEPVRLPLVIKYGGSVMTNPATRAVMAAKIDALTDYATIVVHGGGPFIKQALADANVESRFVRGLRVTDETSLPIIEKTLTYLNKQLAQAFDAAVGLTGRDARVMRAKPLPELGLVGDVTEVNTDLLRLLLEHRLTPVIACLAAPENALHAHDKGIYNVNADSAAGAVAGALAAPVVFLSDVAGVLEDPKDSASLMHRLDSRAIRERIADGRIAGGMIPKVEAALYALARGAAFAVIADGRDPEHVADTLDGRSGTTIVSE